MVNTKFPTVKEPHGAQTRIIVRSPNNDPRSGTRKRARHPRNHPAGDADRGGGAARRRRDAGAGTLRAAVDPERAVADADGAGLAAGRQPAVDVVVYHRDGGPWVGAA